MRVVVSAAARGQIELVDSWWREHRPSAPGLFSEELASALDLLAVMPMLGRRFRSRHPSEIRRVLLRSTRFHVYYRIDPDSVVVVAVWSALRGYGPPMPEDGA